MEVVVVVLGEKVAVDTKVVGTEVGSAGEAVIMDMEVGVGRTRVRVGVRIGAISSSPPSRDGFVCVPVGMRSGLSVSSFTKVVMQYALVNSVCVICV